MLALASLLMLAEGAVPALTLDQFEALAPLEAAEQALEGLDHGSLAQVEPADSYGRPPNVTEYLARERPEPVPGGCRRTQWKINFSKRSNGDEPARISNRYATTQVGLAIGGSCDNAEFVHLNPGVEINQALRLLAQVDQVAEGSRVVEFTCRTEVPDPICNSPEAARAALRNETPFAISPEHGTLELWLRKVPNGLVTKARFDPARPDTLIVEKTIPAPF